jgi:site-specific recombinase XerC
MPNPNSTSALKGIEPIKYWQQKWKQYMLLTEVAYSTRDRYSRAVQAFLDQFKDKPYPHSILRPHVIDYRDSRLKQGLRASTVRLELTAVRSFWDWMMRMQVVDAFFNPAAGVKVPIRPRPSLPPTIRLPTLPSS